MTQGVQWEAEEVSSVRCSQGDKITASISARTGKVSIESLPNLELEKLPLKVSESRSGCFALHVSGPDKLLESLVLLKNGISSQTDLKNT